MPLSLVPSFLVYSYVGAITPGPANLCSLTAALQYGRRPAMRQWRGLFAGFTLISLLSVLITWLLGTLLNDYVAYLSWIGAAYLLWMAWHMVRSAGTVAQEGDPSYPSFRRGFLIQVTNVKVMVLCLTALSGYVLQYVFLCLIVHNKSIELASALQWQTARICKYSSFFTFGYF